MNKTNLVLPIKEQNLKTVQTKFQYFPFHLVEPSPWPLLLSFSLLNLTIGAVSYMHGFNYGGYILSLGFILTVYGMILWFRDVVIEGSYLGHHTKEVKNGLMIGVLLFIVSEVFAFLSVFWAFFHSSLSPAIEIGGTWPPLGITPLDPFAIPLLNTFLLLSSGAFITYGHHALIAGNRKAAIDGVIFTIILAIVFTALQYYEYSEAGFTFADGVYGSAFYASTGLHGLTNVAPIKNKKCYKSMLTFYSYFYFYKNKKQLGIISTSVIITRSKGNLAETKNVNFKYNKKIKNLPFSYSSLDFNLAKLLPYFFESENKNKPSDPFCFYFKNKSKNTKEILEFLEWFVGFTDAEGNFNISLKKLTENNYLSAMLTFQIGLHLDDLIVLEYIKKKLNCGHISISGNKCNFFSNSCFCKHIAASKSNKESLFNIILPIFNLVKLNSSKYFQFIIFFCFYFKTKVKMKKQLFSLMKKNILLKKVN